MMYRILALTVCMCAYSMAAEVESRLSGKDLRGNPDAQLNLVAKGSDLDAPTGFANYLLDENADYVTATATFARRRGMLGKMGQLVAVSPKADVALAALMKDQRTHMLAAVVIASRATMSHLAEEKNLRFGNIKKKKKKDAAPVANQADVAHLQSLLTARKDETKLFALLAAAYMAAPELSAAVEAVDMEISSALGAKLRHQAAVGNPLNAADVAAAFAAKRQPRGPNNLVAELGNYELVVPSAVLACEAIAIAGASQFMPHLIEAAAHKDIRIRVSAYKAMAHMAHADSLAFLQQQIEKASWAELVYICQALGTVADKDSFEPLIARLKKEKGRMRLDIMYALNSIYGERSFRQSAEAWEQWWTESGEDFTVDQAKTDAYRAENGLFDNQVPTLGDFYGLGIYSDRFVFVLDTSKSMQGDKIDDLRTNVVMTLETLPRFVYYNMVDFGGWISVLYPGGLTNDKQMGIEWAETMPMSWGTRSYDAMERGAEFDDADTIYFLSDGAPIVSHCNDWGNIQPMMLMMNRFRPLAVFTVCFKAGGGNAAGMATLAEANYGQTMNID